MTSRPASTPSVLYHRVALLLAVSGGDKLDTMPQEGTFMERMFAIRAVPPLLPSYAAAPLMRPESRKVHSGAAGRTGRRIRD